MNPNVLLIQVDQMRFDCLSFLGHPDVRTPRLDALAAGGTLFDYAICAFPLCVPSRISMLSGRYPSSSGQFGNAGHIRGGMPWLQDLFRNAGYRTGAFGKFHVACIGPDSWSFEVAAPSLPEDERLARPARLSYREYCREKGVPWPSDQIHGHNPFGPPPPLPPGATQEMIGERQRACPSATPVEHSIETWTTNACLAFLEERAQEQRPFFAWLTYDRPHHPTALPEPWAGRVRPRDIALGRCPTAEEFSRLNPFCFDIQKSTDSIQSMGEEQFRYTLATYLTLIEWLDEEIGRVLDTLVQLGLDETTTVVFTSDHGDEAGNHGLIAKSRQISSEALTRVPLIVRPAPVLGCKPSRVRAPVNLVDLYPTLLGMCGIAVPPGAEGIDLGPLLAGAAEADAARAVFCETWHKKMVVQGGWKLIFDTLNDWECQLFDLENDPGCFANRYHEEEQRERRIDLKLSVLRFVLERQHGPATPEGIEQLERGLDPADGAFSFLTTGLQDGKVNLDMLRAGVVIGNERHDLLVPFYDRAPLLFVHRGTFYPTSEDAIEAAPAVVEELLDGALRVAIPRTRAVSVEKVGGVMRPGRRERPPSVEEARDFLSRPWFLQGGEGAESRIKNASVG